MLIHDKAVLVRVSGYYSVSCSSLFPCSSYTLILGSHPEYDDAHLMSRAYPCGQTIVV